MKHTTQILMLLLMALLPMGAMAQIDSLVVKTDSSDVRHQVLLRTTKGDIVVELYNETPLHRDNFLKLVRSGYYDGNLWHRVIADFMIQTGDSTTRHAQPGVTVGEYTPDYTLPAEIRFPKYFHKRGALAAARESDATNPERRSSSSQFYIVYGKTFGSLGLDRVQQRIDEATNGQVKLTPEVRDYYMKYGGTPHLDGQYTVFGEVVKGLNVVRDIDYVQTDDNDRPVWDVKIIKAEVIK
jgi:cyclophilin family peptidyl-prolyl cis-trans isomerase